jgi:hypothetical protein
LHVSLSFSLLNLQHNFVLDGENQSCEVLLGGKVVPDLFTTLELIFLGVWE